MQCSYSAVSAQEHGRQREWMVRGDESPSDGDERSEESPDCAGKRCLCGGGSTQIREKVRKDDRGRQTAESENRV